MPRLLAIVLLAGLAVMAAAQQQPESPEEPRTREYTARKEPVPVTNAPGSVTLPAGTKVPLALKQAISTKNARPGDPVYAETTFPVTQEDRMVIPAGTYVQGVISSIKRPGRVKGRAELLFHFTTLIFPNGYTIALPGSVDSLPGADKADVKDEEGTIKQQGEKGKDAATVASTAATGAAIGAMAGQSAKGAGMGAGMGGAAGLAIALLTRGSDVRLESGTGVEMVLQRPLTVNQSRATKQN